MKPGDVILTTSLRAERPGGWAHFSARGDIAPRRKGEPKEVFSVLYLGKGTLEEPVDAIQALHVLGWCPHTVLAKVADAAGIGTAELATMVKQALDEVSP